MCNGNYIATISLNYHEPTSRFLVPLQWGYETQALRAHNIGKKDIIKAIMLIGSGQPHHLMVSSTQ